MKTHTLYTWVFLVLVVLIIISFFSVYFSLEEHKRDAVQEALNEKVHLAEVINEAINSPVWVYRLALVPGMEEAFIDDMARFQEVKFLRVVNIDGRIVESSIEGERGNIIKEPDIYRVLNQKKFLIKEERFNKEPIKSVIYPGYSNRVIWIGFTLHRIEEVIRKMWLRDIMIFSLSLSLIFLILFVFLKEKVISPLQKLTLLFQKVSKGNLDVRADIESKTEIGQLSQGFNKMVSDLSHYQTALKEEKDVLEVRVKARTKELEELAQELEEKVKARTKELQNRVDELEKFHKLTVGRELKMIELKKEIARLKKMLSEKHT